MKRVDPTSLPDVPQESARTAGSDDLQRAIDQLALNQSVDESTAVGRQWAEEHRWFYAPLLGLEDPQPPGREPRRRS